MQLSLSSLAAPELALDALGRACRARGLLGAELVLAKGDDPRIVAQRARSSGTEIVTLHAESLDFDTLSALSVVSGELNIPVSVPPKSLNPGVLPELATVFQKAGGRLLVGHTTQLAETLKLVEQLTALGSPSSLGMAWELRPSTESLSDASAVLFAARDFLGLIRLYGGGPEQRDQDGRGVGPLLVNLALSGYEAPIVLCPSRPEQLPRWRKWLTSQTSAGCGHQVDLESLSLDVRDVEPKDRLETILGAYHALGRGATLTLTVDHDPSCMYYTLQATEPEGSFSFQTLEHGPEVWRAEVTKL